MDTSILKGIGFGLTSAIITTLGLMVGLNASTGSVEVIVSGVLIIAISDALSDSLGVHISEESDKTQTPKGIWLATLFAFLSKFIFSVTFIIPLLLFDLNFAILISIIWGLVLITGFSFYLAKLHQEKAWKVVGEHISITVAVIILTHYVGGLIKYLLT